MKKEMKPRERVLTALSRQEPDRVPLDFGQAAGDGITTSAYGNLIQYLGLKKRSHRINNKMAQTVFVDEDILQRFRVDFRRVDLSSPDNWQDVPVGEDGYRDEWGVVRSRPKGGYYYDLTESPIKEDTLSAIERHVWPNPDDPGRYRGLRERARILYQETDYAIVLQVNCSCFLRCAELRGWENFYMDLVGNPTFACALMDRYLDIRLRIAERALEAVEDNIDIVMVSTDDLGMNDRTLISPKMYRELIKPRQKRTFELFKAKTPAKRFYHCDGAIYPLIEDFIEIGVDVLNPIQVSAAGMDNTKKLKKDFGNRISFWGAIDTHHILPHGTQQEVYEEVHRRLLDLGPGGGYVVCSVHNIQPEVPPENVVAMFDAAYGRGAYPLSEITT
jgi:uroporphyrinogen decarboxylase